MQHVSISYTPKAVVKFSLPELTLMMTASERHYDSVCMAASAARLTYEGNRPGFLRGMHNYQLATAGSKCQHTLTFRELDTLAKILEQAHYYVETPAGLSRLRKLRSGISAALKALNQHALEDTKL